MIKESLIKSLTQKIIQYRNLINHQNTFFFSSQNVRIPLVDPLTNEATDQHLNRYNQPFTAYLTKRRLTRQQIWPKMYITQGNPQEQMHHLKYQKLYPLKKAIRESMMAKIVRKDPIESINSSFIISVFAEEHFKQMIDQYAKKVLICGKCHQNQEQQKVQAKIVDLFRMYYYGQKITPLEREIQFLYLAEKQQKFLKYKNLPKKNAYFKCIWRKQDQRLLEDLVNYRSLDMNFSDQNYHPFFQPLNIHNRLPFTQLARQLIVDFNWYNRKMFQWFVKPDYQKTQRFYKWVTQYLFVRIYHWTQSLQFTQLMKIPPDFLIEKSIFQIHIWMVIDRLRKIDTRSSRYIATKLDHAFKYQMEITIGSLNVKRKAVLQKNMAKMISLNSAVLAKHFNHSNITKDKPYYGIDAMVWSLVFMEKVQRYSDQVYLFSQYLVKNYQHMQKHSQQDLLNGIMQFDVFLIDPNYKQKIKKINPPLSQEEFQVQTNLDSKYKKYSYDFIQKQAEIPLHSIKAQESKLAISFRQIIDAIIRGVVKYNTLKSFDHYSQMDKRKKEMEINQKNNPWKSQKDRINQVQQQFNQIDKVKKDRRKISSNLKKDNNQ